MAISMVGALLMLIGGCVVLAVSVPLLIVGSLNQFSYKEYSKADFTPTTCYPYDYRFKDARESYTDLDYWQLILLVNYTSPTNEVLTGEIALNSGSSKEQLRESAQDKFDNGFECYYHPYKSPLLEKVDTKALQSSSLAMIIIGCIFVVGGIILIFLGNAMKRDVEFERRKQIQQSLKETEAGITSGEPEEVKMMKLKQQQ